MVEPYEHRLAASCSWEGCGETKDYDPDWKCPPEWGLVEWIPPGRELNDSLGQAILCPEHFASFTLAMRLKKPEGA